MARATPKFGKVQLQIMQILWQRGQATAREITDELCRKKDTAHSTVQTLLRELEAKDAVTHEIKDRTFIFRPMHGEAEVTTTATRDLLSRLFDNSAYGLVSHLIRHENISREELQQLRELLKEEENDTISGKS